MKTIKNIYAVEGLMGNRTRKQVWLEFLSQNKSPPILRAMALDKLKPSPVPL